MKLAVNLIITALALYGLVHITLVAGHFWQPGWPAHALNHLIRGTLASMGLVVLTIIILLGPFRQKQRWAWWCVLLSFLILYGGFFGGYVMTEVALLWIKWPMSLLFILQTGLFAMGLFMSRAMVKCKVSQ